MNLWSKLKDKVIYHLHIHREKCGTFLIYFPVQISTTTQMTAITNLQDRVFLENIYSVAAANGWFASENDAWSIQCNYMDYGVVSDEDKSVAQSQTSAQEEWRGCKDRIQQLRSYQITSSDINKKIHIRKISFCKRSKLNKNTLYFSYIFHITFTTTEHIVWIFTISAT